MNNIISLKERLLQKDLKRATKKLDEVRLLIAHGQHEFIEQAIALEDIIDEIEHQLKYMADNDLLF
tara:strand:- start:112 stop:309 length:198 start_codon:yes stop_codon:yes gene_type:complete